MSPASGIVVDAAGNLYIADTSNHRVRKVSRAGVISTIAGTGTRAFSGDGGPAVSAQLADPAGLALDASGNLYVADFNNVRVRKIGLDGVITTVAVSGKRGYDGDGGPALAASMGEPTGIAIDADGNLYIADSNNFCVRKVSRSGVITTAAVRGPAAPATASSPLRTALGWAYGVAAAAGGAVIIGLTTIPSWLGRASKQPRRLTRSASLAGDLRRRRPLDALQWFQNPLTAFR